MKGDISQWQDIHNILLATYEALIKSAVEEDRVVDKDKNKDLVEQIELFQWWSGV